MKKKSTKLEKERRILTVQGWIIDGAQNDFIIRQIKTQWNLNRRQAERYLKWAYDKWRPQADLEVEDMRNAAIARLQNIARSLDPKYKGTPSGITAVLSVEKELNKLKDVRPPKRKEVTMKSIPEMTEEEREKRIEEILKTIQKRNNGK